MTEQLTTSSVQYIPSVTILIYETPCVVCTPSTPQSGPATFLALGDHMWLMAVTLDVAHV